MRLPRTLLVPAACILSALLSPGCRPRMAGVSRSVPGPESADLVAAVDGYVLISPGLRGITALRLPTLEETTVRPPIPHSTTDFPRIHALAGPDAQGRVAYIEDHMTNTKQDRHLLKTINLDGTEDAVILRPGNALWATSPAGRGEIGAHLALAPTKGRVAFLSRLSPVQMPAAFLSAGSLEIWDLAAKTGDQTDVKALDQGLAWFPDGRRLAFVRLVDPKAVGSSAPDPGQAGDRFGKRFRQWPQVPVVFLPDLETAAETYLHVGWRPVVSADGESVLVADIDNQWLLIHVGRRQAIPVTWPGIAGPGAVAIPKSELVLSWALPTAGTPIRLTDSNSPLVGPKQMLTLKLAKTDATPFQTVVPYIDPRTKVSFGQAPAKRPK